MSKKKRTQKTNVARLLDQANVIYELISYEVDESDLSAVHVANQLNENIEQVFKTIVLKGDRIGYFVCVLPSNKELDLKLAAKISNNKKCELVPMKALLDITGYIRGACSPIGMKKTFPTYFEPSIAKYPYVFVSAGIRGVQLKIAPNNLLKFCKGHFL